MRETLSSCTNSFKIDCISDEFAFLPELPNASPKTPSKAFARVFANPSNIDLKLSETFFKFGSSVALDSALPARSTMLTVNWLLDKIVPPQ